MLLCFALIPVRSGSSLTPAFAPTSRFLRGLLPHGGSSLIRPKFHPLSLGKGNIFFSCRVKARFEVIDQKRITTGHGWREDWKDWCHLVKSWESGCDIRARVPPQTETWREISFLFPREAARKLRCVSGAFVLMKRNGEEESTLSCQQTSGEKVEL